jgi:hypothetical protein
MIWFLEDYRDDVVLVVRVQHFELPDPTGLRHRHGHCVTQTTTQNWNQPCAPQPRACGPGRWVFSNWKVGARAGLPFAR